MKTRGGLELYYSGNEFDSLVEAEWMIGVIFINNHDWRSFTKKVISSVDFTLEEHRKDSFGSCKPWQSEIQ